MNENDREIRYGVLPEEDSVAAGILRPEVVNILDRPAITKSKFTRFRSLAIDIIAWVDKHDTEAEMLDKVLEIREIINGK